MADKKATFLEEAIQNAGNEILEEVTLLLEGGQKETIAESIQKIIKDLMDSAENFEYYAVEREEEEEDDSSFQFKIGQMVVVTNKDDASFRNLNLANELGHPEVMMYDPYEFLKDGDIGQIIARKFIEERKRNFYVIRFQEKKVIFAEKNVLGKEVGLRELEDYI